MLLHASRHRDRTDMRILLVGSGGREHAMAWALSDSPLCDRLVIAPGNPGMAAFGEIIDIAADDNDALVSLALEQKIDLAVIGPEVPLVSGLADRLNACGIAAFGPGAAAARLEGSKSFARAFCARHDIPQPAWAYFTETAPAKAFAESLSGFCVIKADGLAAGKGVIVCDELSQAVAAIDEMLSGQFGAASAQILVEERITGPEFSAFALVDGDKALWLASAQDHKRAFDNDEGPNTGGMGAVSPSGFETEALRDEIMQTVIQPVASGMAAEGNPYRGILYAGLMLTASGPQVIEFNCRFGDPEAQVILPRLKSDFLSAVYTLTEGGLDNFDLRWRDDSAVTVVMANKGYPGSYDRGGQINGADDLQGPSGCLIFHAGTGRDNEGRLTADGGRVLCVTALGDSRAQARERAYAGIRDIDFPNGFFRTDIASE